MFMRARYALPCAGVLVLAGAQCASMRGQSSERPPPAPTGTQ